MSLPWFRVDNDLVDHPKVFELASHLKDPNAGWYVIRLWAWTSRYAARGKFADGARTALERSCGWIGEPGKLIEALLAVGLLDAIEGGELEVHDWWEKQGAIVEKAEKDRERKRLTTKEPNKPRAIFHGGSAEVPRKGERPARVHDETRRDETKKDSVEETSTAVDLEASLTDDEFQVFEHWRVTLNHPKARPTSERKRLIAKQLKTYSVEELQAAITGCSRSPHHMGENDRHTKYDDLGLILRDAAHIERFAALAPEVARVA